MELFDDVDVAAASIDQLIERRSTSQDLASAEARAAKALEHQRREKRRERNRLLWAEHFERLAASLRSRAEDYEQRASSLLLGEEA